MSEPKTLKKMTAYQKHGIFATALLAMLVLLLVGMYMMRTSRFMYERCFYELSDSTEQAQEKIEANFRSDRVSLRMLSKVIADQESLYNLNVKSFLTIYDVNSLISNVAVLTPENVALLVNGRQIDTTGIIDYATEIGYGEHISGLQPALDNPDSKVIRNYVPIRKNGKSIGLLYAEMSPSNIARAWKPSIYDGEATFSIIERKTGDIIVTNWNESIKNVSGLESDELADALTNGKTGFQEIHSQITNDTVYISYMPMELERWEMLVAVRKDEVFALAESMYQFQQPLLIGEAVLFLLYFIWIMNSTRHSIIETEHHANVDVLTGLQNRNRYEALCHSLKNDGVACIYVDANGLHEINNTKGHLAGDQMLRFIADTLKVAFGEVETFRIGGDEFVVFQHDKSQEELESLLKEVHENIQKNDYHISAGLCMGCEAETINDMIKTAEFRMYDAKKQYYESIGKEVRNHISNHEEVTT
ncbi:MAG: sensor domain-containing diguanylate cyclase [Oscillospiraceae bacterium]